MVGLLVIIVISWLLLHFIEKKGIDVLGIIPNYRRLSQFIVAFIVITIIVLLNIFFETQVLNVVWKYSVINYSEILNAFGYHFKSALTEDLVFRGALLYILIQRIGVNKALWISAFIFGMFHWFSYGILGDNIILMAYVLIITGFTGYVWVYTFYKTNSIMMG